MTFITLQYVENNVLTDPTSVKFSSPDGTYGLREISTNVIHILDNVSLTRVNTGIYTYEIPDLTVDVEYWIEITDTDGSINHYRHIKQGNNKVSQVKINRRSTLNLYELKMYQGESIDLYYNLSNSTNLDTGDVVASKQKVTIRRAVITPLDNKYKFHGATEGVYKKDDSVVLIDRYDLVNYVNGKEDYFVYRGKKFMIVSFEDVQKEGYIFVIRNVQNDLPNQEITLNIRHDIGASSSW